MKTFGISERRACGLLNVWRSSCRYRQTPDDNEVLRERLMELASERPRFGYRRLGVLLARQGEHVNHKRLFRVYRQAGLSVKRTRRKKLLRIGVAQPILLRPNQEWSLDFVSDALGTGRAVRILSVVDNFTRECLALETDTSFASLRVTRVLDDVIAQRGVPKALRMDNGPESDFAALPGLVHGTEDRHASHSARQTDAEWPRGELVLKAHLARGKNSAFGSATPSAERRRR
jgi:putative transposase